MKLDFGRWTATKAALVVAGALTIAGAIGSAVAMSPIVEPPIKWQGGWEAQVDSAVTCCAYQVGTVPAGRNLILTDVFATNATTSPILFTVYQGSSSCTSTVKNRLVKVGIPASDSVDIPLGTGIGFSAGQEICVSLPAGPGPAYFNFRGFLFTAAPAS